MPLHVFTAILLYCMRVYFTCGPPAGVRTLIAPRRRFNMRVPAQPHRQLATFGKPADSKLHKPPFRHDPLRRTFLSLFRIDSVLCRDTSHANHNSRGPETNCRIKHYARKRAAIPIRK